MIIIILGSKDHQLVTWSKDQSLRIWKIDPQLQKVNLYFKWQMKKKIRK